MPRRAGRGRLSRRQVADDQQRRLLDAMAAALVEHGYEETRVADVLELARISRATFYRFFESKRHCFQVAYDDALLQLTEAILLAAKGEPDWTRTVRSGVHAGLRHLAAEPARAHLFAVEGLAAGPAAAERHHAAVRRLAVSLAGGRASGPEVPILLPEAESVIAGGVALMVSVRVLGGEADRLPELEDRLTAIILMPEMMQRQADPSR